MKKKTIAAVLAALCVLSSLPGLNYTPKPGSVSTSVTMTASAAYALPGRNAARYSNPYADTQRYTYSISLAGAKFMGTDKNGEGKEYSYWTDESNWDADGMRYSLYKVEVKGPDDAGKDEVKKTEYCIGIMKTKSTDLDVDLSADIDIPASLNTYLEEKGITDKFVGNKIAVIADSAFANSYLKTVNLSGIKYIGASAFSKCQYITEIDIPASVNYVGKGAFQNSGLKTLTVNCDMPTIPDSLCDSTQLSTITFAHPEFIRRIGNSAFNNTPVSEPIFASFPADVSGYEDLYIGQNAYSNCKNIKAVNMSDNVEWLSIASFQNCTGVASIKFGKHTICCDKNSFQGCTSLTDIQFNDVLEALGGGVFSNCTGLKEVKGIPDTITDWVAHDSNTGYGFGNEMFSGCTSLVSCDLPKSITKVPEACFRNCKSMKSVYNGDGIVEILKNAFNGCSSLLEASYADVTKVGENAFQNCTSLITADLPKCNSIAASAFKGCSKMTEFTVDKCTTVGNNAMEGCSALKEIKLLSDEYGEYVFKDCSGAEKISVKLDQYNKTPKGMFSGCSALKTVDGDLTKIEICASDTFKSCKALEKINLPALRIIESNAFTDCIALKSIKDGENAIAAADYGSNCFKNCSALDIEVKGSISTIGANAFQNSGINKINIEGMTGGTVVIGNNAFSDCANLKQAVIRSENAASFSVGTAVFSKCTALENAAYEGEITNNMFINCTALKEVVTNASTIGSSAFQGDKMLKLVKNQKDPTKSLIAKSIGSSAFKDCTALQTAPMDKSTTFTGTNQFQNCASLKSVEAGMLTQAIFSDCIALSDVKLNGISDIPNNAFYNCPAITSFDLSSMINIGNNAFAYTGLNEVKMEKAQTIGNNAFANCGELKKIDVNCKSIGSSAFSKCDYLADAVIYAESIGSNAFSGDSSLRNVTLQTNDTRALTAIGSSAFSDCPVLYEIVVTGNPKIDSKAIGFVSGKVMPEFMLVGEGGSTVEKYASANNVPFCDIKKFNYNSRLNARKSPGDVDGNSVISIADAVKLQSWLLNKSTPGIVPANMDVNSDGKVNAFDMVAIKQKITAK